jgi:hypothetical protein
VLNLLVGNGRQDHGSTAAVPEFHC